MIDGPLEEAALVGVGTCVIVPLEDEPRGVTDPRTEFEIEEGKIPEEAELILPDEETPLPVETGYGALELEKEVGRRPEKADLVWIDGVTVDPLGIG